MPSSQTDSAAEAATSAPQPPSTVAAPTVFVGSTDTRPAQAPRTREKSSSRRTRSNSRVNAEPQHTAAAATKVAAPPAPQPPQKMDISAAEMASASWHGWLAFFRLNKNRAILSVRKALMEPSCNDLAKQTLPHHTANGEVYTCNVCGDEWATKQQLALHLAVAHNRPQEIRRFIPYPVTHCWVCMLEKHTRALLVQHLTDRSKVCGANLMLRFEPAPLRLSRQCDFSARKEPSRRTKKPPLAFRHVGPTLPVVGIKPSDAAHRHPLGKSGHKYLAL